MKANKQKQDIPLSEKYALTISQATLHFGIGRDKILEMTNIQPNTFVLYNGTKTLIKRKKFEEYLDNQDVI